MSINPFSEPVNESLLRKQKIERLEKAIGFLEFSIERDAKNLAELVEEYKKLKTEEAA